MARANMPTVKLSVVLIKPAYKKFKDILKDDHALAEIPLKQPIGDLSALYVKEPHQNPPSWSKFLEPISTKRLVLANASSSAVLFVEVDGRIFSFCFGHGRTEIKQEAIVHGFGLKATLNRVNPNKLRSLDSRTLENGVTTKRLQTSRNADQTAYGIDVSRDLLRQVVGHPENQRFAKRLAGSDSLTIHMEVSAEELGEKCKELLVAYNDKIYKEHFDWVDHLAEISDPKLRNELDHKLAEAFSKNKLENMHLAATSIVDWENVEKFKIGGARKSEFSDLDIEAYASSFGSELAKVTIKNLKNYKIQVQYAGSDSYFSEGSVYASIVWEVKNNGGFYAFVDGHWYEIDNSYATKVEEFVKSIPVDKISSLLNSSAGEKEDCYNQRVSKSCVDLILLDKELVWPDGSSTSVEFCDLFSKSREIIHVKRKTRSATLSHLFAQGTVSAELFVQDAEVRKQVKAIIRGKAPHGGFLHHIPDKRPDPKEYKVVYAIISKPSSKFPLSLPFFSQVNLMHSCKKLAGLGFNYAIQQIEEK